MSEPEKFGQEKNGAASENIVDVAGAKSTPVGMVDQNASPTAESQRLDNNVQQGFARLRAKREAELLGKSGENKNVTEAVTPQAAPSKGPLTDDEIMSIAADYNTSNAYRQGMILQSYSDEDQKKIIKAVSDLTENDRALSAYGYGKSQTRQMTKFESGKLTDDQKKEFLQSEYIALGKPIPRQFRDEAKRLGMLTAADSPTVVSAPTNAPTAVGAKSTPVGSKIPKKSDTNGNVAIAAGPGTNAAAAVEDELYKRSEVNNPWAKYWHGHYSASDQAVTEDIRSFQEQSPGGQRSFLKDFFDRGETPYPYLLDAAQKAGIVDKSGNLITEAAGSQYGAVKNPAQTTAGIKATADTMKTSPDETAKTNEASKQEAAKKLAILQQSAKPTLQKGALAGGSQSVPRASGNLGTSISGPIDELLGELFNHMLLNDLNKNYPTSYAV
jgi:hypothetical protein